MCIYVYVRVYKDSFVLLISLAIYVILLAAPSVHAPCIIQVPVLRNRQRAFGVIESPWDSFGPMQSGQSLGGRRLSPDDTEFGTLE